MTPEIEQKMKKMQSEIDRLKKIIDGFFTAPQLDPAIKRTLSLVLSTASGKTASSENQSVNEAGASTYSVLKPPDRFIKIGDQNVPAYDA